MLFLQERRRRRKEQEKKDPSFSLLVVFLSGFSLLVLPQQRAAVIFKLFSASHFSPKGFSKILIEIQCLIKRNRLWNFLVRSFLTMTRSFHADSFEASSLWRLSGICWRGFSPIGPLQLTSTTGRHKGFDEQSMNPLTGSSKIQSQTA